MAANAGTSARCPAGRHHRSGRVGRRVARLCQAFEAEVVAYDSYVDQAPQGVQLVPLEEASGGGGYRQPALALWCRHPPLADKAAFARMKPGACSNKYGPRRPY